MQANTTDGVPPAADGSLLHGYLSGRDCACPGCGYNLRDLNGERCPECGRGLTLIVEGTQPKPASALLALIGLACGAGWFGYSALPGLFWFVSYGAWRGGPNYADFWLALVIQSAASAITAGVFVGAMVLLWRRWERFLMMSSTRRKWMAGLSLAAPLPASVIVRVIEGIVIVMII